ncbi:LLM class flavin-dependent oxidoreductase [Amycolatopsis minnesotensis]|uniref:LLM class flavin-dependent oxidoreductase n=1 Tax=Amycolatopsis minnesotensis TaxID=337894 RepID=A0ABP5CZW5_9PSEU
MAAVPHPHLAVALEGAGAHPAAWREPDARPAELVTARYWAGLVAEAESGLLDFVTLADSLGPPPQDTGRVHTALDAVLVAARVAPLTSRVGLVPSATATHTEPFHLSKAIATVDYVSEGRAGVQIQVSAAPTEAAQFGRRRFPAEATGLHDEAADYVEVLRRLWDSWEDDAEIRDVPTGRFVDRDKLHYADFEGKWFSVKGPSITPRPPQGQPVVATAAVDDESFRLAGRSADLAFVTPRGIDEIPAIVDRVRTEAAGRIVLPIADLIVFLDETASAAADRKARLDDLAPLTSDTAVFTGTPAALAEHLVAWHRAGLPGFRLWPGALPHDLTAVTTGLVPELRARDAFRDTYEASTLRGLLGLDRPANRYAA